MRPLLILSLVAFALLVGAGVFTAAHRFLKQLGGPPESDTGHWVEPRGAGDDEDV